MLIVLSPAKTLDYTTPAKTQQHTLPQFVSHSEVLIEHCKKLTPADIGSLMKVSDKIAGLNAARFAQWQPVFTFENSKQAVLAFKGDVYTGLDADNLDEDALLLAQEQVRILSGLYGILKPLDLMQPYRLEMGTKLENQRGKNLYQFWGTLLAESLNEELKAQDESVLVNLASNEYFKAIDKKTLAYPVLTPSFLDEKNGQFKMISFYAKKARGLMTRFIIEQKVEKIEQLKAFNSAGYQFDASRSSEWDWVFTRTEAAQQANK